MAGYHGLKPWSMLTRLQAETYHTSINRISYLVSINVLRLALGPVIWNPSCDTYGRRLVYLTAMLITVLIFIACAATKRYGVQIFTEMLKALTSQE
jgi:MFS family permease